MRPFSWAYFALLLTLNADAVLLPTNLCRQLPQAPESAFAIARTLPEFSGLRKENLRQMPSDKLLYYLNWAAQNKISALEIFSDELFRDPECVTYIDHSSLWKADQAFELYLIAPIAGWDTKKQPFYLTHFFGGMGRQVLVFNRDRTVFVHPIYGNKFELDRYLRQKTPRAGFLALEGIRALVYVFFKERRYNIDSLTVLPGKKLLLNAEGNKSVNRLFPIQRRPSKQSPRKTLIPALPGLKLINDRH